MRNLVLAIEICEKTPLTSWLSFVALETSAFAICTSVDALMVQSLDSLLVFVGLDHLGFASEQTISV